MEYHSNELVLFIFMVQIIITLNEMFDGIKRKQLTRNYFEQITILKNSIMLRRVVKRFDAAVFRCGVETDYKGKLNTTRKCNSSP